MGIMNSRPYATAVRRYYADRQHTERKPALSSSSTSHSTNRHSARPAFSQNAEHQRRDSSKTSRRSAWGSRMGVEPSPGKDIGNSQSFERPPQGINGPLKKKQYVGENGVYRLPVPQNTRTITRESKPGSMESKSKIANRSAGKRKQENVYGVRIPATTFWKIEDDLGRWKKTRK
ncbi:hypothetical protein EW146_g9953 [Bondarzewia mesenterica]|uniref:Uncharacterized protein n=1 Tax=Bondarzewia mesenterica TaxID=1095465 RepID=A0A4S4L1P9_9AGAM|nr:hypothetical protein EW146_g9953 [Bondarzewia mesenterica]